LNEPVSTGHHDDVGECWYGLTLVPRDPEPDEHGIEEALETIVRSRQERGWELVRVSERDHYEMLVFRRPA